MKVEKSRYLKNVKPILKTLLKEVLKTYPYASILATDSKSTVYRVNKVSTGIEEDSVLSNRGFVIKAYDGHSYGEYSFNEISEETISEILDALKNKVFGCKTAKDERVSSSEYPMLSDEPMIFSESTEYQISIDDMGDEAIIARLTKLKDEALAQDPRIINCTTYFTYQKYTKLFLSPNRDMEQNVMWTNGFLNVNSKKGDEIQSYFQGFSLLGGAELLDSMEHAVPNAVSNALDLLNAEPMVPGEYDCICTPGVTGMIAHEAFGHGVEMDMFVKDRALAKEYVGRQVASPMVTMHDGAKGANETATYFFDDEGVLSKDTVIIKDGILQTGISDLQSAMSLGTTPTGNGRRESYRRKAYTRMTNTYFEKGTDKVDDMIASIQNGVLLDDATSGMEDPKNWGIQCMVNIAREIKDGKLTGRIFSPCVLSGYVPDLLKSISMVSDDSELCGVGYCGKGYKEWVKVSDGGPYIKAKIRLG